MKYYIYFDAYENPSCAISDDELTEKFSGDPDEFLSAMCGLGPERKIEGSSGHVSVREFDNEKELNEFLESLGDEVEGFYVCQSESRPYNF